MKKKRPERALLPSCSLYFTTGRHTGKSVHLGLVPNRASSCEDNLLHFFSLRLLDFVFAHSQAHTYSTYLNINLLLLCIMYTTLVSRKKNCIHSLTVLKEEKL